MLWCSLYGVVDDHDTDRLLNVLEAMSITRDSFTKTEIIYEPLAQDKAKYSLSPLSVWKQVFQGQQQKKSHREDNQKWFLRQLGRPLPAHQSKCHARSCLDVPVDSNVKQFLTFADYRLKSQIICQGTCYLIRPDIYVEVYKIQDKMHPIWIVQLQVFNVPAAELKSSEDQLFNVFKKLDIPLSDVRSH